MRILNAARCAKPIAARSKRSAFPSLVLMENAGRQVVAAHRGDVRRPRRPAGRGALRPRQQRRRRLRRRAHAAAARRRRRRSSSSAQVAEVRGDARINLEILGRLGLTVVEIDDAQAWELHFSEISRLRPDRRRDLRHRAEGAARRAASRPSSPTSTRRGIPVVSIDLPSGLSADTPEPIGDSIDATMTVTLAAPKLPLVLPPAKRTPATS